MATSPGKGYISQLPSANAISLQDYLILDQLANGLPTTRKAQLGLAFPQSLTINNQVGTTYTPILADQVMTLILMNHPSLAMTLIIPPNSSVAFPVGTNIMITGQGPGLLTIAPGAGVTINTPASLVGRQRYSPLFIEQVFANVWNLGGDLQ